MSGSFPSGSSTLAWFLLILILQGKISSALHLSNIVSRSNNNCKEVLTIKLECPSIGSFAVAGACDYFVRCLQTENGVESEADFCPDGQIFVVNRCVKSQDSNDCPQKLCPQSPIKEIVNPAPKLTTAKPYAPTNISPPKVTKRPRPDNVYVPNKPFFPNLHPSLLNSGFCVSPVQYKIMLLFVIFLTSSIKFFLVS